MHHKATNRNKILKQRKNKKKEKSSLVAKRVDESDADMSEIQIWKIREMTMEMGDEVTPSMNGEGNEVVVRLEL